MHTGGPQTDGPQTGGAHTGGAQRGLGAILLGAGASKPPMIADGMPITAPHTLVQAPSKPPSNAKGPPPGPHVGGAQLGGGQVGGAHTGGATIGGPPAIPTDG